MTITSTGFFRQIAAWLMLSWFGIACAGAAPLKIVAVGASNTSGWGVGVERAYPAQLERLLRAKGVPARVINAGRPFDTTAGMLHRLDRDVPGGTQIVILQPGGNDRRFFRSREQRAVNIEKMENRLRARKIKVIVYDEIVPRRYYAFDGIHFTAEGHAMIANRLLPRILQAAGERN